MSQEFFLSGAAAISCGLVFIVAALFMQEVRSRLVSVLIELKSPLSMQLSDWSVSGGRIPGNYGAINREFIWGPQSVQLAGHPKTASMVRAARALYLVREVGRVGGFLSLAWFLWVAAAGAP
jgi:hypothetical protein